MSEHQVVSQTRNSDSYSNHQNSGRPASVIEKRPRKILKNNKSQFAREAPAAIPTPVQDDDSEMDFSSQQLDSDSNSSK